MTGNGRAQRVDGISASTGVVAQAGGLLLARPPKLAGRRPRTQRLDWSTPSPAASRRARCADWKAAVRMVARYARQPPLRVQQRLVNSRL